MPEHHFTAPSLEEMNVLLPSYEFENMLSSNEVGAVYHALQKSLDRYVAVKIFAPDKGQDEGFLESLKNSTKLVAGLKHPNLIGFIDSGMVECMPFLVMEFVPGKSLHRSTHGHTIEFKLAKSLVGELCEGISEAHEKEVIHGNLSPLNILLNQEAVPKIGNFALGRGIHTLSGVEIPTHFTAPEVLAGETATVASDIYSLGAILYELITATPWHVGAPQASELEDSPQRVDKVIDKACHSEPAQRYQSAKGFLKALEKAASNKLQAAEGNAPARPPARSKAKTMVTSASHMGLAIKAVIIALLLISIKMVWEYRKGEMERLRLAEEAQSTQGSGTTTGASTGGKTRGSSAGTSDMTPAQREAQKRQQELAHQQHQTDPEPIPDDPETPMESLERLRSALKSGNFSELPIGTISHQGKHYFVVEQAMGWEEAVEHAEQLGGVVALPSGDMGWSSKEPITGKTVWLGAGRSGAEAFTLLNGQRWQPKGSVGGGDSYVHLDRHGSFKTSKSNARLPYVIEWSEGAKPLNFDQLLAATAKSVAAGSPVYPPGTIAVGERHYLAVSRSVSWKKAVRIAKTAGGHLMTISDDKEAHELENWRMQLPGSSSYWMGGHLAGNKWEWATGEPWRAIEWANLRSAAKDGAAMILRPSSGMEAMKASSSADGFIIEWSEDPETNKTSPGRSLPALTSPTEITDLAKKLVVKAIADKEAAHKKNTDKLAWDLRSHMRGLNKSDQDRWGPEIDKLNTCVQNNRITKKAIDATGARLSPFMASLCNYLISKQSEIDKQHVESLKVIHASYLEKLEEVQNQAKAQGQVKMQVTATELIGRSENYNAWITKMSGKGK